MRSLNRVYLVGRLGATPEKKVTKNGKSYAKLSLATHRRWQLDDGKWENRTDWHRIMVWGEQAEKCASRLSKGSPVFVEGHISRFEIPGENGSSYQTAITADQVSFLTLPLQPVESPNPS